MMIKITLSLLWNLTICFQKTVPNAKVGFSKAMAAGWISLDKKAEGGPRITRKVAGDNPLSCFEET